MTDPDTPPFPTPAAVVEQRAEIIAAGVARARAYLAQHLRDVVPDASGEYYIAVPWKMDFDVFTALAEDLGQVGWAMRVPPYLPWASKTTFAMSPKPSRDVPT